MMEERSYPHAPQKEQHNSDSNKSSYCIVVRDVHKYFGDKHVLKGISLEIPYGKIYGLLGPSGCGKTTMVKIIAGLLEATSGEVDVLDEPMPQLSLMNKLGYMAQSDALYGTLTAGENLRFFGSIYGMNKGEIKKRIREVMALVNLSNDIDKPVQHYSGGMKRRLSLAMAILHHPPVLVLDEPTAEELKQSANSVSLAEIALEKAQLSRDQAKKEYERLVPLCEAGAVAQSELDKAEYQWKLAEAAAHTAALELDNAWQKLALLQKGTRQEKIDAAQADVALTEVQIRQAEENLAKYTITALHDGTVISKNYLLGNMVSSGFNLVDIASEKEKHMVAYVPKRYLAKICHGQTVVIRSEGKQYQGTIGFIDVKAQYTPKELQSSANKNKESMKIKANLASGTPLKVGERAELVIPIQKVKQ